MRVDPIQVYQLLLPRFDDADKKQAASEGRLLAKGLNASPGAASGKAIFDADRAEELGKAGTAVVLVRPETSPDDVHGMLVAKGILTARGGATSHAAVVARGLGLPCVAGTEGIRVSENERLFRVVGSDIVIYEGDDISIDGGSGEVFAGIIKTVDADYENERRPAKAAGLGRSTPSPGRLGQRGLSTRREKSRRFRSGRHWPLSYRAYVHGAGASAHCAEDDPR